jgi:UrcA family protein
MTFVTFTRRTVPITAVVACVLFAGTVVGAEREITVDIHVSAHRLDISQPAGAQKLYQRLKYAAHLACTSANRVGLEPSPDTAGCYEKALGEAIRSVNAPLLTRSLICTSLFASVSPLLVAGHPSTAPAGSRVVEVSLQDLDL